MSHATRASVMATKKTAASTHHNPLIASKIVQDRINVRSPAANPERLVTSANVVSPEIFSCFRRSEGELP